MAKKSARSNPVSHDAVAGDVTGGVDTHRDFHVAAALDALGRVLGTAKFDATAAGYAALRAWLAGFGPLGKVGIEGTGDYGAGLTMHLVDAGASVVEVNRPNRQKRRLQGKSDPVDAINAARAVLSGEASTAPKLRRGPIESVRVLRETRTMLVKARTTMLNTLRSMIVTAPAELRESLPAATPHLVAACAALGTPTLPAKGLRGDARTHARAELAQALLDSNTAVRSALAAIAASIGDHDARIAALDTQLEVLLTRIAANTMAQHGVGPDTAAQLLITAGDNPDRIHHQAAFAKLTGVAPLDASSGLRAYHRLSRAGDRQANAALYRITLTRLATCPRSKRYAADRLAPNGTNKKDIIRKLKRYIARELFPHIKVDLAALTA